MERQIEAERVVHITSNIIYVFSPASGEIIIY